MIELVDYDVEKNKTAIRTEVGDSPLFLCGYGLNGKLIEKWFSYQEFRLSGIIDKRRIVSECGIPYLSYGDLKKNDENGFVLISSGSIYCEEMRQQLLEAGIRDSHIINLTAKALYSTILDLNIIEKISKEKEYDERFCGIHQNERAFLIGNGPSLRIEDLSRLKNEITFSTNEIYGVFPHTQWRPTYYIIEDRIGAEKNFSSPQMLDMMLSNAKMVLCSELTNTYRRCAEKPCDNLFFYKPKLDTQRNEYLDFSGKPVEGVVLGEGTSMYSMYQFAMHMGIKEIFLVGVDCSYPRVIDDKGNIIELGVGNAHAEFIPELETVPTVANVNKMIRDHMSAKMYADAHGVKIYNATRGGQLEVFPRVDLDRFL